MAQQAIDLGAVANDGTGDSPRDAGTKINDNFTELYGQKAPLASPAFTGNPTAPTQTAGNNSTRLATTAFVAAALAGLGGGASSVAATRTALAAIASPSGSMYLAESGREGWFTWSSSNNSANVTADAAQGIYVPPASATSGASGAWVRKFPAGIAFAEWFGVDPTVTANHDVAINAALALAAVSVLMLPSGTITTGAVVVVPSYKSLVGVARDSTILKGRTGVFTGLATFPTNAIVCTADGAINPRVQRLTVDVSKLGLGASQKCNGVVMRSAQGFVVEDCAALNVTNYAFWAMEEAGGSMRPNGVFRRVKATNFNVGFECSHADGVLWDGMEFSSGDGDIACEAVYHPLAGSRNVTYRNGKGTVAVGGIIVVVSDSAGYAMTNIRFINCDGTVEGDYDAFSINKTLGGSIDVVFEDCELVSLVGAGGTVTAGTTLRTRGGSIQGKLIGVSVYGTMEMDDSPTINVPAGVGLTGVAINNAGGTFRMRSGTINLTGPAVNYVASTVANSITDISRHVNVPGVTNGIRISNTSGSQDLFTEDQDRICLLSAGYAQSALLHPDSTICMPVGTQIRIVAGDTYTKTIDPQGATTINGSTSSLTMTGLGKQALLVKTAASAWVSAGDAA
jgi:hypothetical protein